MMKFTSSASALALSAFAQVQNDYVQCEDGMVGCNEALDSNVCYYVEDDQDCQTPGCNSGSWTPKILNVIQALNLAMGLDNFKNELTVHMINRERLII